MEQDYEIPDLPNNPTMAEIKLHKEKKTKKSKAKACLFASRFTRIMTRLSLREMEQSKECMC